MQKMARSTTSSSSYASWLAVVCAVMGLPGAHSTGTREGEVELERRGYSNIDPLLHMCEMGFHHSVIMNNTWYIHGGYVGYDNGTESAAPNPYMRAIDLTKPYSLRARNTAPITITDQPDRVPEMAAGVMWGFKGRLYEVGGEAEGADKNYPGYNKPNSDNEISVFDPATSSWSTRAMVDQSGKDILHSAHPMAVSIPETGKGYYLGGLKRKYYKDEKGSLAIPEENAQLSVYDFESDSWTNSPTKWKSRSYGMLTHIPFGEKGLLVAMGGFDSLKPGSGKSGVEGEAETVPLSQIDILDLNKPTNNAPGTWAKSQIATAANEADGVPTTRMASCAVAAVAPDGSSAQIFMYGGTVPNHEPYGQTAELWVLSIPSFEWYLLKDYRGDLSQTNPMEREGMTCNQFGDSKYMMMFGGRVIGGFPRCETTASYVLDLSAVEWKENWDGADEANKRPYTVPKMVYQGIGGDGNGGAKKLPKDGIADSSLRKLFNNHLKAITKKPTPPDDSPNPVESPKASETLSSPSPSTTTSTGMATPALTGIIIGAIVVLSSSLGLGAFLFRRHRRKQRSSTYNDDPKYIQNGEPPRHTEGPDHLGMIPLHTTMPGIPQQVACGRPVWGAAEMNSQNERPAELQGDDWSTRPR